MLDVGCSPKKSDQKGSVLIIVLWIAIGLVGITLYFANSMTFELRASDNRASGLAAEQAIEGAARYVGYALFTYATNGTMPTNALFNCANLPVGDARCWIIGLDTSGTAAATDPVFGLIDEGSKLNLNRVNTNTLSYLPNMTEELAEAIVDWRSTNGLGNYSLDYATLGYDDKNAPFETVDELRLVTGMTGDILAGDDLNRNGILDAGEKSLTGGTTPTLGLLEYTTVYSREPNFHADGTSLTNVNSGTTRAATQASLSAAFQAAGVDTSYATAIASSIYPSGGAAAKKCAGALDFCARCLDANMNPDDISKVFNNITTTTNAYTYGRVNINTASEAVLTALFMGANQDQDTAMSAAQTLITYRQQNPSTLNSPAWFITALGNISPVVTALLTRDWITTKSYQFTADIAAVGPFGRGYRRVKFIFDIADGTPRIIYRQDLSRLGWALGEKARETLVAQNTQ